MLQDEEEDYSYDYGYHMGYSGVRHSGVSYLNGPRQYSGVRQMYPRNGVANSGSRVNKTFTASEIRRGNNYSRYYN